MAPSPRARPDRSATIAGIEPIAPVPARGTTSHRTITLAAWTLALALCATAWAVDPFADASFDAPKRLFELLGALLATMLWLWQRPALTWRGGPSIACIVLATALASLGWLVLATLASPHPDLAWPALRRLLTIALFFPLGASSVCDGSHGRRLFGAFVLTVAVTAVISLLQAAGMSLPLTVAQAGGRFDTGALLGNEGYVALACALLATACVARWVAGTRSRRLSVALVGLLGLCLTTIIVNQQRTSVLAFVGASLLVFAVRWRMRWLLLGLVALVSLGSASMLLPPLRALTWQAPASPGIDAYQRLSTYRLGAWISATAMIEDRPWFGYGPGSFGAEALTHRYAAELRLRERLVQPTGASFVYAHQEYLQLAAEAGLPALALALTAFGTLLWRLSWLAAASRDPEHLVVVALLGSGAIAALAWFPLQTPFTAIVLLLACGRGWRLLATGGAR